MRGTAAAVLLCLAAAPAAALTCPDEKPEVTLTHEAVAPRIDRAASRADLTALSGSMQDNMHALGMYDATWKLESQSQVRYLIEEGKRRPRGCVWLSGIRLSVVVEPRVIRIARELRPDSCRYKSVMEHERKHQAIDDALLARRMPWLRSEVERGIAGLRSDGPQPESSLEAIGKQLMDRATAAATAAWQQLVAERDRLQAEIDTPAEYERVRRQCRD